MGPMAYVFIGIVILGCILSVVSYKMNKSSKQKWLSQHPGAVKISFNRGNQIITQKDFYVHVLVVK
ncbi:hypothetical protein [Granulicatella sp. zg-ZJ]|uniref:hypothetical protein n=1 Tax=Granulicatella sp. zg-ZJ TaxID=2678504 RepID=UPI001966E790|nr:hypothetical protein [Granulicatella sp. zg-ZJ]